MLSLSFVSSQAVKDKSWIQQNADATDLPFDDYTAEEMNSNLGTNQKKQKELVIAQRKLKSLVEDIDAPISSILTKKAKSNSGSTKRKAKHNVNAMPVKRRRGFVVINPNSL